MILFLTNSYEQNVLKITQELDKIGASYNRLNVDSLRERDLLLGFPFMKGDFLLNNIMDANVVWERKPEVDVDFELIDEDFEKLAVGESREFYKYLYYPLKHKHWVNPPHFTNLSENKIVQLDVARRVGLLTPNTIVTNRKKYLEKFIEQLGGQAIIKMMSNKGSLLENQLTIDTSLINKADLNNQEESISISPVLSQECIEKKYEIRLIYIYGDFYCGAMDIKKTLIDERIQHATAPWFKYELDSEIKRKITDYHNTMGLNFSCVDLIENTHGEVVFLESNSQGQYDFISDRCNLDIHKKIAEKLHECD